MSNDNDDMIIIPEEINHGKCVTFEDLQEAGFYDTLSKISDYMM